MQDAIFTPAKPITSAITQPIPQLLMGILIGLLAASIGALYIVCARWGILHGLSSPDLTALRFGVAGTVMLRVLIYTILKRRRRS
jgi:hypothetical protein